MLTGNPREVYNPRSILRPLLDLMSVPAYVTDRFNRVWAVNRMYAELVGDPIADGLRGEDLFIIGLVLGRYRESYPRRHLEVAACAQSLSDEIESGRLVPQTQAMLRRVLLLDDIAERRVRDVMDGYASRKWNGLVIFKQENGRHLELE